MHVGAEYDLGDLTCIKNGPLLYLPGTIRHRDRCCWHGLFVRGEDPFDDFPRRRQPRSPVLLGWRYRLGGQSLRATRFLRRLEGVVLGRQVCGFLEECLHAVRSRPWPHVGFVCRHGLPRYLRLRSATGPGSELQVGHEIVTLRSQASKRVVGSLAARSGREA